MKALDCKVVLDDWWLVPIYKGVWRDPIMNRQLSGNEALKHVALYAEALKKLKPDLHSFGVWETPAYKAITSVESCLKCNEAGCLYCYGSGYKYSHTVEILHGNITR